MQRLIIICEGQTEVEFCKDVLSPHFTSKGIFLQSPLIKKSGGGIVPWQTLKKQIRAHLLQDRSAVVTTLIDYYGIKDRFEFPGWADAKTIPDKDARMTLLEQRMLLDVDEVLNSRFVPYLQLHEFEGLLFNDMQVFLNNIPEGEFINKQLLIETIRNNENPELINDIPGNAPSLRLARAIKGYNKIVYGAILAKEIGLHRIRSKSPRFNRWLSQIEIKVLGSHSSH